MGRERFEPKIDPRHRTLPESEMVEVLLLGGWAFEVDAGDRGAAEAATREALDSWVGQGLGYRLDPERGRLFDPVEVVNFFKWSGLAGRDRFWADRYVATGRALVEDLSRAQGRFRLTLERTFNLRGSAPGARVRLRAPLLLRRPGADDVEIEPMPVQGLEAEVVMRDDHMEVRCLAPPGRTVTIGVRFAFTPPDPTLLAAPGALSPQDRELYLRPAEGLIQVTPRVQALADRLAGDQPSTPDAVAAFWAYMLDELMSGAIRYSDLASQNPMDWVLEQGWCDCRIGSALLVSLCRARGIPARLVGGHVLYRLAPTNHTWSEIWVDGLGWRAYDLLCWDLSQGGEDPIWRDRFAGAVDPRAVTERLPLAFTGPMSVRFPPLWRMTQTRAGRGIDIGFYDIEDGCLIYKDHVVVETAAEVSGRPIPGLKEQSDR